MICGNYKARNIFEKYTRKPIVVIPLAGVDTDFFVPAFGKKEFQGQDLSDKVVFSFVGALDQRKGLIDLVMAFAEDLKKKK